MMGILYLVSESIHFPGEVLFNGCFDQQFVIKRIVGLPSLTQELENVRISETQDRLVPESHVIVLSLPSEKIGPTLQQVKGIAPNAVCIILVEARDVRDLHLYEWDCLFLEKPLSEFTAKTILAAAVKQVKVLHQLSQSGYVDERSGLYSQKYFLNRMTTELALAKRHREALSCVSFGVRYYDMYLDCYGYGFIEKLFHHLGDIFKTHIRQEDVVARMGDDEIGLMLPRSDQEGAQALANRIIQNVAQRPISYFAETETIELYSGIYGYSALSADDPNALTIDSDQVIRYSRHALHHARKQEKGQAYIFNELYPLQ